MPGRRHPNSLAALAKYRPIGWAHCPQCEAIARSTGERCRLPAVKSQGQPRCNVHGGASRIRTRPGTPYQRARRALRRAVVPLDLASNPAWQHASLRRKANVGALLAMLAAWGAKDAEGWARAVRVIV
jgi:hypothetical protein